jgi:MFS family permease
MASRAAEAGEPGGPGRPGRPGESGQPSGSGGPAVSAWHLLRRNAAFRWLCSARVISSTGDSLSLVALMLQVAGSTGRAFAVSLLLLAGDFAPSLLSPVTGAVSDRFDRRRVLIGCELVQGALLVVIAIALPPLPLLLALVAVRALAGQVFGSAARAAVPALVHGPELAAANSAVGIGGNGAEAAGPLLAAALLPLAGIRGVLLADAASFLASAAMLTTLPALLPAPPAAGAATRPALLGQARAGLRYLLATPVVRVVTLGFCAVVACTAIDDVALVLLATDTFRAGAAAVGLLLGAVGVGLLLGYLALGRRSAPLPLPALLVLGFAVSSLGNLLTGLAWAVAAAVALQLIRGLGIAAIDVATNTLLQRLVPPALLGRVFGNLYGGVGVAAALSYLAGGLLLDATNARVTFVVAGAGGLLATAAVAVALPRALRRGNPT